MRLDGPAGNRYPALCCFTGFALMAAIIAGHEISAVIFDCDGVLVDSEVLAIKGERRALGELGLDYSPQ